MKIGDPVTVVAQTAFAGPRQAHPAYVIGILSKGRDLQVRLHYFPTQQAIRAVAKEGIEWCRGHSGPAVDALRAAQALV